MSKPTLKEVLAVKELKDKQKKIAEDISNTLRDMIDKYGEGKFSYIATDPEDTDKKYMNFTLVDELEKLKRGEDSGRFVYSKTESCKVGYVKGKPKTL